MDPFSSPEYLQFLGIVGQAGEEDDAEHEEEDEQSQFLCGCLERVYENTQAGRVTR